MKKEKGFPFIWALCAFFTLTNVSSQIFITEIADPKDNINARFVELYNAGNSDIDLSIEKHSLRKWTNDNTTPNNDFLLTGIIAAKSFYIIAAKEIDFKETYFINPNQSNTIVSTNGDDHIALVKDDNIIDIFGVPGQDGTNTCHEYKDGRAERKTGVTNGNSSWIASEWNVWADNEVVGCPSHNDSFVNTQDFDPGKWIGAIKPGLSISFPSENTSENTSNTSFSIVLDAQPSANIVIDINSNNTSEIIPNHSSVTFTDSNWNVPQSIILTGVDDNIIDGAVKVTITVSVNDITSDNTYKGISSFFTLFNIDNETSAITINEIHADPDNNNGDANNDGIISPSQDEFIEIYNSSNSDLDISNWSLADETSVRHIFEENTIIPSKESIVVFGGGTPNNIPGVVQTASSGRLSLNNSKDVIQIITNTGNIMVEEAYNSIASQNQSIAKKEGLTNYFGLHSEITSNPILFSPGRNNTTNIAFSSVNKWNGTINNDWNNIENWSKKTIPSSSSDVLIPKEITNYPTITNDITVNSITLESSASLTSNNSINANVRYIRELVSDWHLISTPLKNQTIEDFILNNDFSTGSGNNIGIGFYNNDNNTPWEYQNTSSNGSLSNFKGMAVKTNNNAVLFEGNLHTEDTTVPIKMGDHSNFNLIGNPYTSYLNSINFLNAPENISVLEEQTIWFWNGTEYITKNLTESFQIAPTQGFFIKVKANDNIIIDNSMLSHQTSNTFLKDSKEFSFQLYMSSKDNVKSTKVFFNENATIDFDNGYDSSLFLESNLNFSIYTRLANLKSEKKLAIQSLSNSNYQNIAIPIGLICDNNQKVEFSVKTHNLPSETTIFLEDKKENSFINLSENNYSVLLTNSVNEPNRFSIHLTTKKTNVDLTKNDAVTVDIFKSNRNEITVKGLNQNAILRVYSILGEEVKTYKGEFNDYKKINVSNFSEGMYFIKLEYDSKIISKKIVL
ncbi:lamin tail domain-containing protein [Tenacibaculum sp. M341]|uniref:lamin tail domain-containing protein n=1 Tax=Tenacibaculum sp. M341 TaxID=2530339 RepID=UPI00104C38FA|nr:lamin tail domain-containing protein [Tenacibaculum sp. M341]TCI85345.1 T9SS type A sorting domain-containing protein [Tenacibaculum sp. M341]